MPIAPVATSQSRLSVLPPALTGLARTRPRQDFTRHLEPQFERRAVLPRLIVVGVLLIGALMERGPGHGVSHWTVLGVYSATTLLVPALAPLRRARDWLPWAATAMDAALAVYVITAHLPRDAHEAHQATDALSLVPALLFLLQTGLRLRPALVWLFAGAVSAGWAASLVLLIGSPAALFAAEQAVVSTRQMQGMAAFLAATFFVLSAVAGMRRAASAAAQERDDRLVLSRFVPEGLAGDIVRGEDSVEIARRHACLLSVDIRGSSLLARDYPSASTVAWLLAFRRIVHEAVTAHGGVVDKYLGDGVLVLFLKGEPPTQARDALAAARAAAEKLGTWNAERGRRDEPRLRTIMSLHAGEVLAGVFDDGCRAEFTVLGEPMNELPRIERRAKEADADVAASMSFVELLPPPCDAEMRIERLASNAGEAPALVLLSFRPTQADARPARAHPGISDGLAPS